MTDSYTQGIAEATRDDVVATAWDGEEVYRGEKIWELGVTDDIVYDDVEAMNEYLEHRIHVLGGEKNWLALDLGGQFKDGTELAIELIQDYGTTLTDFFEGYYDGRLAIAGEE